MKRLYDTLALQHSSTFWKRMSFHGCFIVFSAVFLFANLSGWAHVPVKETVPGLQISDVPHTNFIFSNRHADPHPFNTNLVFVETEVIDETQSGNEYGNGLDNVNFPVADNGFHTGKSTFQQLKLLIEGRERISLFVLHHCWKSFLL